MGALLEPYGELSHADARAAYEEQARALVEGGVDAIIIETQTALEELGVAIDAAKAAGVPCIIASLAYDLSADKLFYVTMMGVMPDKAAEFVAERGAHIIALNCGTGMDMNGAAMVARQYRAACALPTMVQPNAGLPVLENMKAVYKQLPADMALGVRRARSRCEHHRVLLWQHSGTLAPSTGGGEIQSNQQTVARASVTSARRPAQIHSGSPRQLPGSPGTFRFFTPAKLRQISIPLNEPQALCRGVNTFGKPGRQAELDLIRSIPSLHL